MIFEILLVVGFFGFVAMTALSFLHGHGHSQTAHGHAHGHAIGHDGPGHTAGHHAPGHPHHAGGGHASHETSDNTGLVVVKHREHSSRSFIPSPLDLFSIALGAGATGIIAGPYLAQPALGWASALGGLVFSFLVVRPLFAAGMRFVSDPSEGLEGTVASCAEAISRFDASGRGLVRLNLDGQIVQLLARLTPEEIAEGVTVQKGDQVVLIEVDGRAGSCKVTKELTQ